MRVYYSSWNFASNSKSSSTSSSNSLSTAPALVRALSKLYLSRALVLPLQLQLSLQLQLFLSSSILSLELQFQLSLSNSSSLSFFLFRLPKLWTLSRAPHPTEPSTDNVQWHLQSSGARPYYYARRIQQSLLDKAFSGVYSLPDPGTSASHRALYRERLVAFRVFRSRRRAVMLWCAVLFCVVLFCVVCRIVVCC